MVDPAGLTIKDGIISNYYKSPRDYDPVEITDNMMRPTANLLQL